MSKKLDRRNYMRNTLLALSAKDKPFIIRGYYVANPNLDYVTYTDIRPYVPQGASTNQICNHINITAEQVERYIDIRPELHYVKDFLVCRARIYHGRGDVCRGGVVLTEELGIPPVMRVDYPKSREILAQIPKERYIDFFTYAEGRYAYYGENPWVNGHKVRPSKPHIERRKVQYQEPEDISPELFMDMFAQANPLWIPPPRNNLRFDPMEFISQYIPQLDLQELLFERPRLRKQVISEFRRRM